MSLVGVIDTLIIYKPRTAEVLSEYRYLFGSRVYLISVTSGDYHNSIVVRFGWNVLNYIEEGACIPGAEPPGG